MLKGTGISDGVGLGKAIIFKSQKIKLEKNKIKDVTLEKEKFYKAIKEVEKEIEDLLKKNIWNRKRNYASISFNITRSKFDSKNN